MAVIYKIDGRQILHGQVTAQGLPGAAVAGMAASLLTDDTITLQHVPHLPALDRLLSELRWLGVTADWTHAHEVSIKAAEVSPIPLLTATHLISRLPLLVTALTLRCGACRLELQSYDHGGLMQCMDVIRKFGGLVEIQDGLLKLAFPHQYGTAMSVVGLDVHTCMAAMLIGASAEGQTELTGVPGDSHITALHALLTAMGADVTLQDGIWRSSGRRVLGGANVTMPADPLEAGFFSLAALVTGGEVVVRGVPSIVVTGYLSKLRQLGADYRVGQQEMRFWREGDEPWQPVNLHPKPYPGIPANWMPMFLPLLAQVNGETTIELVNQELQSAATVLRTMGAEFFIGESIKVFGPIRLAAAKMTVSGQSEGLAAVLAALSASGTSEISGMELVEGQFEHLSERLQKMGAKLSRIER